MKRIIILIAVVAAITFTGCNMMAGSGNIVDYGYSNKDFRSIAVSSACELSVTEGDTYSVTITGDDNLQPYIEVIQVDELLTIRLQPYTSYNNFTFRAAVVMPALDSLSAGEASSVSLTGFTGGADITMNFSEASKGDISFVSIGDLDISASDASSVDVSSSLAGGTLTVGSSGASSVDLSGCEGSAAVINVTDASEAVVNVSGTISGRVTNASTLYYYGSPGISGLSIDIASSIISR